MCHGPLNFSMRAFDPRGPKVLSFMEALVCNLERQGRQQGLCLWARLHLSWGPHSRGALPHIPENSSCGCHTLPLTLAERADHWSSLPFRKSHFVHFFIFPFSRFFLLPLHLPFVSLFRVCLLSPLPPICPTTLLHYVVSAEASYFY